MASTKKMSNLVIMLIPIGVAINGQIAILLKLPVYLDCIGTMAVAALAGPIPGVIVGVISNILNSITAPIYLFYAICSILIALAAAYFSKNGTFLSFGKSITLGTLVFSLIGGVLGACITWIIFGGEFGTNTAAMFAVPLYNATGMSKFICEVIAEWIMDLVDKAVTVAIVYGVLKSMPVRTLSKLPLGDVYIQSKKDAKASAE